MNIKHSPQDVYYIGSSELGLQALSESDAFNILKVLCLESRATKELITVADRLGHDIVLFKWHDDFRKQVLQLDESNPFFIYQLDMLVPEDLTLKYSFYNVHRGCLINNRGPNPDVWPILHGHSDTSISLHKINGLIDSGTYINSFKVIISELDDSITVKDKLEKYLPEIVDSLSRFLIGKLKGKHLSGGQYYPWITEGDFTIDIEKDSIGEMERKIKCQRQYNGAILIIDDDVYYVNDMKLHSKIDVDKYNDGFSLFDERIIWCSKGNCIEFSINKGVVYKPMISRVLPIDRI